MKCYACDILLSPETNPDTKTGRYYCGQCFEPTNEVLMSIDLASIENQFGDAFSLVSDELMEDGDVSLELLREKELQDEADQWLEENG